MPNLNDNATETDAFDNFPHLIISVGKTSDSGAISIFTNDGVPVHKENDDLITFKGKPILIGARDSKVRYHIPLVQQQGNWQPCTPTKMPSSYYAKLIACTTFPSLDKPSNGCIQCVATPSNLHAYWQLKQGTIFGGLSLRHTMLRNVTPETTATPKGHVNQTRKHI